MGRKGSSCVVRVALAPVSLFDRRKGACELPVLVSDLRLNMLHPRPVEAFFVAWFSASGFVRQAGFRDISVVIDPELPDPAASESWFKCQLRDIHEQIALRD